MYIIINYSLLSRDSKKKHLYRTLSRSSSNTTLNEEELINYSDSIYDSECDLIHFDILSNPEFLAEGTAVNDILFPDRILIGGENNIESVKAQNILKNIYSYWVPKEKIILMNLWSSELSKLVINYHKF